MTESRGLVCTKCMKPLGRVGQSYPLLGGGHRRTRYCECGAENVTIEWVVGAKTGPMLLITGLDLAKRNGAQQKQVQAVKALVESMGGRCHRL